jgi:hypothetical protein
VVMGKWIHHEKNVTIEITMEEMVNVQHNVKNKKKQFVEIKNKKKEKNVITDLKIMVKTTNVQKNVQYINQNFQTAEMVKLIKMKIVIIVQ